jgi:hypothetical protein
MCVRTCHTSASILALYACLLCLAALADGSNVYTEGMPLLSLKQDEDATAALTGIADVNIEAKEMDVGAVHDKAEVAKAIQRDGPTQALTAWCAPVGLCLK